MPNVVMGRIATAVVVALLGAAITACAAQEPEGGPLDGGGTPALLATSWTVVDSSPGSRVLTIRFLVGRCEPFERVDVTETETEVEIVVLRRAAPPGDCPAEGLEGQREITLDEPLGSRTLSSPVDGPDRT